MRPPSPGSLRRPRTAAVAALLCVAAAAAVGLGSGLVSCQPAPQAQPASRPVTQAEATLLAGMRVHNYQDWFSGLRGVIRSGTGDVHFAGWVDWRRPLIYINSISTVPGPADGLVEAVPGLVAVRTGRMAVAVPSPGSRVVDPYPPPPVVPPADGWRVRQLISSGPAGSAFDTLLALLFTVSAKTPDNATLLAGTGARFVRRDEIGGVPVAVIDGPAVPPAAGTAPRATGNQVRYWLDGAGRLRRLDALLATGLPVEVEFHREDRTRPAAIDLLGGGPVRARPVTSSEAQLLARVPARSMAVTGGQITLTLPVNPAGLVRAQGWLNWRTGTIYLAVRNPDDAQQNGLVRADRYGVSTWASGTQLQQPPLKPPQHGWRSSSWRDRARAGGTDLDVLLNAALTITGTDAYRSAATFLRRDRLDGVPVLVFEMRAAGTQGGWSRRTVRCWLDASGVLRRLELRTRLGAYAYLDITPGPPPDLPGRR
ncbi:MAG TPA: hypothetical protein VJT31_12955 [Rugosimonospora sp.]|nr:hypothetical protein [Rugosimonospora sp.]